MDQMNLLDLLTSARDNLKRKRDQLANVKKDLLANETVITKTLRSEFVKLRETLYETETRVLDETKNAYKQKLTELEAVDGEISQKIQLLSQLQLTEAVKIPIPDVSVNINLDDFETAAEKIKAIQVLTQFQPKGSTPGEFSSKTGSSSSVNLPSLLPNSPTPKPAKRVSANDEPSATDVKKKKKPSASARRPPVVYTDDSDSESDLILARGAEDRRLIAALKQERGVVDDDDEVGETSAAAAAAEKLQIRSNVRDFINCSNCHKPRCIYAKKALSAEQSQTISQWKEKVRLFYKCGDKLPASPCFSNDSVGIEDNVNCHSDVDIHYFYPPRKFPLVCYTCGSDNVACLTEEEKKNYSTYNPVCERCSAEGQEPRTKKKIVRRSNIK